MIASRTVKVNIRTRIFHHIIFGLFLIDDKISLRKGLVLIYLIKKREKNDCFDIDFNYDIKNIFHLQFKS